MKKLLSGLFVLVVLTLVWTFFEQPRRIAIAELGGGNEVSMRLRPMFSMQSDWTRTLVLLSPSGHFEKELPEDTGWWRGSNLYLHDTGVYVMHEGQAGCVTFTMSPPKIIRAPEISCEKVGGQTGGEGQSRFYRGMRYLGQFIETAREDVAVRFIDANEAPEPELPDIL